MTRKTLGWIVCGLAVLLILSGLSATDQTLKMVLVWAGIAIGAGWFIGLQRVRSAERSRQG